MKYLFLIVQYFWQVIVNLKTKKMNIEELREYCLAKPKVTESFPFDEYTLVFKVMGKMFLLAALETPELSINVKCNPELAVELREKYSCVKPGYHMNKAHWNTVLVPDAPTKQLIEWIDHSYNLVVDGLPKKDRLEVRGF
jgi:predicted DNA-binding protein (MmcQ/YjbR family)